MKVMLVASIVVALFLSTCGGTVLAQKHAIPLQLGLCTPDCHSDLFVLQPTFTDTLPGGCIVQIEYGTRLACGVWHDLQITKITPLTPGCNAFDPGILLNLATLDLMQKDPMGFPPHNPGECDVNWRISRSTCWKQGYIGPSGEQENGYVPCDQNTCCLQYFTVCIDDNGHRIVTETSFVPPSQSQCPNQSDPNAHCWFVCS
jgi:hypothetical protein